jgi:hypothetical protein
MCGDHTLNMFGGCFLGGLELFFEVQGLFFQLLVEDPLVVLLAEGKLLLMLGLKALELVLEDLLDLLEALVALLQVLLKS